MVSRNKDGGAFFPKDAATRQNSSAETLLATPRPYKAGTKILRVAVQRGCPVMPPSPCASILGDVLFEVVAVLVPVNDHLDVRVKRRIGPALDKGNPAF